MNNRQLFVGVAALTALATSAQEPTPTVFEGATIIVGDGSAPIEDAAIVVEGLRFTAVGPAGEVEIPEGATRVDLSGRTVMPAIVDTHAHLSTERADLIRDMRQRARFGVGAVLSLGLDDTPDAFRIRGETIPGAALYRTAGRGITAPEEGRSEVPHWVTTVDEAEEAVREETQRHVEVIKIWVDDRNGQYEKLSPAIYEAIIEEAHRAGTRVTAHIFDLEDAKGLLRAGVDAFAHGIRDTDVDNEVIQSFKDRPHVVLVPNLPDPGVVRDLSWLEGQIPTDEFRALQEENTNRPQAQQAFELQARNLDRLAAEGVRIALGTDGNTPWSVHLEMEDMVAAGMSPAEVIVAATRNSAAFLRLADHGTVETGKMADFIVLEANPLENITNTRRIVNVYLRGSVVDRDPTI